VNTPAPATMRILHAARVIGYASTAQIAQRAGLDAESADGLLLDAQALGQVAWSHFTDEGGWSLTETGKTEGERLLAIELDTRGARPSVEALMVDFEPLNNLVTAACTRWQLTELGIAQPPATLPEVLGDLTHAADQLATLEDRLVADLSRFEGYHARFTTAVTRAATDPTWVTATDRDSAHRVWFELHEDLLATLGRPRQRT
jgi:hypothetical protein